MARIKAVRIPSARPHGIKDAVSQVREKVKRKLPDGVNDLGQQIEIDIRDFNSLFRNIQLYRNYAMGRHRKTLTVDQEAMLFGVIGNQFADNICDQILSEHANRLELLRINCKDEKVQKWIDDFWQKAKWDDLQTRVHRNAIRDGNYCLMVEWNEEKETIAIHREQWWDGFRGVFIGYDVFGDMLYAIKQWQSPNGMRRNVYYEGAIERYVSNGGREWWPYLLGADLNAVTGGLKAGKQTSKVPVTIPRLDGDGNPIHIPFIHFPNPGDEFDNYGESIMDGGVVGNQDQVNDLRYDMAAASRMTGFQRTWSKGYKLQQIRGRSVKPKTGPGVHYHAESDTAEWGVLQSGDMSQLINSYSTVVQAMCRMTGTPYSAISGNWPSGEAVYKLEQPIRGATKSRQKRFAPAWVEVMHRCIELANIMDHAGLDETALLTAEYTDAGDRDPLAVAMSELSMWQSATYAVQAGMPLETFLKIQGWGEDAITGLTTDIANDILVKQADIQNGNNFGTGTGLGRGGPNGSPNTAIKPTIGQVAHAGKKG